MNFFYANGTPIINSLKVTSEVPLDPRLTVENIAERDSLVTNHISYDRMKVYVKSNDTKYIYHKDTGEWEIDNKFSEEDKSKLDKIDNYLIDTEHIYNPENKLLYREHSYDPNTDITTLRDHILQEARVSENGELYNGLLSKFYVNRLNNITNYLIDVSFTKGTDVPNLYLTTHSYNPDEDKTTLTNIDIPLATDDNHGLLSNLQNIKVNRIVDYVNRIDTTHTNAPDTGLTYNYNIYNPFTNANVTKTILIPLVTHTENGLTSSSDKIKIDDIETYVKSIALRQVSGTEELGIDYIITNPNDQTDTPGYFNIPLVSPARKHWMDNASGVSNTGTTSDTWQLDKKDIDTRLDPNGGVIIKDSGGVAEIRNSTDSAYSDLTLNNITIKGDVTQEGRSFITEAETVEVRDNTLLLNRGETGAGVSKEFAGIEIDRGSEPKYQILFDESDDRFKVGKEGDLWCVTLRDDEADMVNGMFTTWDSSTKRLKTTNIVPSDQKLSFGDNGDIELKYSLSEMGEILSSAIPVLNIGRKSSGYPHIEFGLSSSHAVVYTDALNGIYLQNQVLGRTFKRATDLSEVLYHADIVNNLTSGGTNKVLSAEQGKLLQNSITSIQGSYLPLSGGTMTGSIIFPNRKGIFGTLTDGTSNIKIAVVNANNNVEIGNSNTPLMLVSNSTDLTHYRDNNTYKIWDKFNLSDPVTLSGNNTFTGNNTFQAGKFNVGPFKVTSSGTLLLNISLPAGSSWNRNLTFKANSDSTSSFVFGGFNSVDDTSIGYAYIGIGDIGYSTAQYRFYSNRLEIPKIWRLVAESSNILNVNIENNFISLGSNSSTSYIISNDSDLKHRRFTTTSTYKDYIVWDSYNLPTPASTTDLANYLPLIGGTLTGQLTIKQSVDIKLRLQSTDADNYCIIQAINSQASQLGVFGYAGDKWAIGHGGTYYEIWDKYNLTNPVRYALDASNYPTLLDSNGSSFSYIKAGPNGILPNTSVSLSSGGTGYCGTLGWSFKDGYFANVHTYKILIGPNDAFIDGQSGDSSHRGIGFYTSQNAACPVYVGSLCVSDGYANSAPNIPTNGIYSKGVIKSAAGFTSNFRQTNLNLAKTGNDVLYISSFVVDSTGAPGTDSNTGKAINDGMFLTYFWVNDNAFQLAADIDGTGIAYRQYIPSSGNSTTGWKFLADTNWVVSKINSSTSNFLKKTGDTATGQIILDSNGIAFKANTWTNDLTPNKNYSGYLQVLDAYDVSSAGGPTNYGTVLQVNSRNSHWANQLWFPGGAEASKKGLYYRHMAYNQTEYGEWNRLLTNKDVNILSASYNNNPNSLPTNQIFYAETQGVAGTPTSSGLLFSVQGDDEGIQLWAGSNRTELYYRTKWTSFGNWIKLATTSDLGNYLPLTGGTLSGKLTINTVGSPTLVINNNDTNGSETFMRVLRKGNASAAIGFRDSLGAYIYNYNSNKYLFIDNDGYVRVGTTSGSTRLALITDIPTVSGYLPLSGGTLTGALTMSSRRKNIVVDVVGGAGNNWNEGAGALSIQIPNDNGQTPLLLARRSGATINTTTLSERLLDMELLDIGTIFRVGMSGVNALELNVTSFTNKVGIGKLFGKRIATTDQIPSIPSISISNSGSGNAVTAISASGHTLTVTKGATYLTSSSLDGYATQTWANGQFASLSLYNTTRGYSTIRTTGNEFCLGNTAATSASNQMLVNYRIPSGCTYAPASWVWRAGSSTSYADGYWGNLYMNDNLVATQSWSNSQYPLKTGTGASGTWGISITGNATTATTATKWNGYSIWTGTEDELPSSRNANTLYFVKKS